MPFDPLARRLLDTAFRGGLAVALYLVFPAFSDVYRLWEREAGNPSFTQIPFEYPPISAFYFEPLTLLPSSRWAVAVNGMIMVGAAMSITWALGRREADGREERVDLRLWMASPALIFLLPVNWDVLVALVCVVGVTALYQSRVGRAGFWLGLGTAFKVFPGAIVIPALPLIRGLRKRILFLALGGVSLVGSYLVYRLVEPDNWRFHLDFASKRGDIQSTIWGLLDRFLAFIGLTISGELVNVLSSVSLFLALLLIMWWVARTRPTFAEVASVAIIALLTFNKVFKPQYILWVLPFLAWAGAQGLKVRVAEAATIVQFGVIYLGVTSFVYPVHTAVRVAALVWIAVEIIRSAAERAATAPS
jgi:hypothetical protein